VDDYKLPFNIFKDLEYKELEIGKKIFLRPLVINELRDEMNLAEASLFFIISLGGVLVVGLSQRGLKKSGLYVLVVRYHCGGWPEEVNSCVLNSYMVYL
jgi:hypothetical protein